MNFQHYATRVVSRGGRRELGTNCWYRAQMGQMFLHQMPQVLMTFALARPRLPRGSPPFRWLRHAVMISLTLIIPAGIQPLVGSVARLLQVEEIIRLPKIIPGFMTPCLRKNFLPGREARRVAGTPRILSAK